MEGKKVENRKMLVSLSGGLDSAVTLALALSKGMAVATVSFTYGSKHNQYENASAEALAYHYGLGHRLIDLSSVMVEFRSNLLKSGGPIPEGHYAAPTMTQTVVPGRNLIFLSILAGLAESEHCEFLGIGVHAGDHHIYPDCRPEFIEAARSAIIHSTEGLVFLWTPFLNVPKGELVRVGHELQVPFHLTRTCYKDQPIACGVCGACQERKEAFAQNNLVDPLQYEV